MWWFNYSHAGINEINSESENLCIDIKYYSEILSTDDDNNCEIHLTKDPNKICIKNDESEENYCIEKEPSLTNTVIPDLTITPSTEEICNPTIETVFYSISPETSFNFIILILKQLMNWPMNLLPLQQLFIPLIKKQINQLLFLWLVL